MLYFLPKNKLLGSIDLIQVNTPTLIIEPSLLIRRLFCLQILQKNNFCFIAYVWYNTVNIIYFTEVKLFFCNLQDYRDFLDYLICLFNVIAILFLVALNGFFVASEFSIVKVRPSRLDCLLIKEGQISIGRKR